jgi:hypothetical protein
MKAQTLQLLSLTMALSYISVRAQDSNSIQRLNRDASGVDASIHAGVDEHQEAQPPQEVGKRPTTSSSSYSHSLLQSGGEPPTARFWPVQAAAPSAVTAPNEVKNGTRSSTIGGLSFRAGAQTPASSGLPAPTSIPTLTPPSDSNTEKIESSQGPFSSWSIGRSQNGLTGSQRFKTVVPQITPRSETGGFSAPFREKQFGLTSDSSSLSPAFPKTTFSSQWKQVTASRSSGYPKKSPDGKHTGAIVGLSDGRRKPGRSRLTTKAN